MNVGRGSDTRLAIGLLLPGLGLLLVLFVLPLVLMGGLTLFKQNPLQGTFSFVGFEHYRRILTDEFYLRDVIWLTLRLALISTAAAVVLGVPVAYSMARAVGRSTLLLWVVLMPLWVNVVVRLLGWMILLADRGPINVVAQKLGIIESPVRLIFNEFGVLVGLIQITVPFVVLPLIGVIRQIPVELEQVAWSLGAGRLYTFRKVILPLSMPGIMAGSLLAFALNATSYVIPSLLGGGRIQMAALLVYEHSMVYGNLPFAGALGMVLLAMTLAAVYGYARALARANVRVSLL